MINCELKDLKHIEKVRTALTHPSFVGRRAIESNQALETVGDGILKHLVSKWLYNKGIKSEKDISIIRSTIVSNRSLERIGKKIGIPKYLKTSRSYQLQFGDIADAFEALIGAISLETGPRFVEDWLLSFMEQEVTRAITQYRRNPIKEGRNESNPVNRLFEYAKSKKDQRPKFTEDFDHVTMIFTVTCHYRKNGLGVITSYGKHKNKKVARKKSCFYMLKKVGAIV